MGNGDSMKTLFLFSVLFLLVSCGKNLDTARGPVINLVTAKSVFIATREKTFYYDQFEIFSSKFYNKKCGFVFDVETCLVDSLRHLEDNVYQVCYIDSQTWRDYKAIIKKENCLELSNLK